MYDRENEWKLNPEERRDGMTERGYKEGVTKNYWYRLNSFFVPSLVMRRCGSILFMFSFELHKICYGRITMYMYNKKLLPFSFKII